MKTYGYMQEIEIAWKKEMPQQECCGIFSSQKTPFEEFMESAFAKKLGGAKTEAAKTWWG